MQNLLSILMLSLLLFYSCNKRSEESAADNEAARYGSVIRVKPEKLEEYKVLHANPWPEVNRILRENNIRNYSIYYRDGLLFSYFEYVGHDYDADMRKMAEDSITQSWWKLTDPCQEPIESAGEGVWWAEMEEVYHLE